MCDIFRRESADLRLTGSVSLALTHRPLLASYTEAAEDRRRTRTLRQVRRPCSKLGLGGAESPTPPAASRATACAPTRCRSRWSGECSMPVV